MPRGKTPNARPSFNQIGNYIYIYIYMCVCVCVCVQSCRYATVHNMNTFIFSDYVCFVFKHRLNSHTLEQMAVVCLKVSSEV